MAGKEIVERGVTVGSLAPQLVFITKGEVAAARLSSVDEAEWLGKVDSGTAHILSPLEVGLSAFAESRHSNGAYKQLGSHFAKTILVKDNLDYPSLLEYRYRRPRLTRQGLRLRMQPAQFIPRDFTQDLEAGGAYVHFPSHKSELHIGFGNESKITSFNVLAATFDGNHHTSGAGQALIADQEALGITEISETPYLNFLMRCALILGSSTSAHGNPGLSIDLKDRQHPLFTFYVGGNRDYTYREFTLTPEGLTRDTTYDVKDDARDKIMATDEWKIIGTADGYLKLLAEIRSLVAVQDAAVVLQEPRLAAISSSSDLVPTNQE